MKKRSSMVLAALFCCLLWGSAPPLIKLGYAYLHIESSASVLLFAGIRFFLAGLLVLCLPMPGRKKEWKPTSKMIPSILVLALFQTIGQYFFYYMGLTNASGVMASILSGTSAFFSLLLSACVFHLEKLTVPKGLGVLLGFFGILVMNWTGLRVQFQLDAEGFLLISQICSALSAVFLSIFGKKANPVLLSCWQFMVGGLVLSGIGLGMGGWIQFNLPGFFCLVWLALVSGAAYTIWGLLLAKYPVSNVGIFSCTIPLFGVLISGIVLHEQQAFSLPTLISLALIASGVYLINSNWAYKKNSVKL